MGYGRKPHFHGGTPCKAAANLLDRQFDSELAHFWLFFTQIPASPLVCAMSAVGHCGDNAACEGLFGMLKRKRIYRTKYPTLDAARTDVFE